MKKYDKKMTLLKSRLNDFFEIEIESNMRQTPYVNARTIYFIMCKRISPTITHERIAKSVNRDHSTVTHALKGYDDNYKYNLGFRKAYDSFIMENDEFLKNLLEQDIISESQRLIMELGHLMNNSLLDEKTTHELFHKIKRLKNEYTPVL
jgi:hypothetical protein